MLKVDIEDQEQLKNTLIESEKLLWTGRPKTGIIFRASDIYFIPFSLAWFGFLLFAGGGAFISSFDPFMIPFVFFGLYLTVGRFFWNSKERENIIYGLTGTRILIRSGVFFKEIKSYDILSIPNIELSVRKDGFGTIDFNNGSFLNRIGMRPNWEPPPPQFDLIENANDVYSLLLNLKHK